MISPISAKSMSSRMASVRDCAARLGRRSMLSAVPWAWACRRCSRSCQQWRDGASPLWCLKQEMADRSLIQNVIQNESAQVGSDKGFPLGGQDSDYLSLAVTPPSGGTQTYTSPDPFPFKHDNWL